MKGANCLVSPECIALKTSDRGIPAERFDV